MDTIRALADQSIRRACAFASLGIAVVMLALSFDILLACRAGAALAGAATFALGKAFCFYYRAVHQGHVPKPEELRNYYQEQLAAAQNLWSKRP